MTEAMRETAQYDAMDPTPTTKVIARARPGAARPPGLIEGLHALHLNALGGERLNMAALEIGDRIRRRRLQQGLTQSQLAERAGCRQSDLSDIERGKGKDGPSYRVLQTLLSALGAELEITPRLSADERIQVAIGDGDTIVCSAAPYDTFYPLISQIRWGGLNQSVLAKLPARARGDGDVSCLLFKVAPASKCRLHANDFAVLATLKGSASMHVRKAFYRSHKTDHADAVAVLQSGSEVEVHTPETESLVLMAVPAGVLMERAGLNPD